MVRLCSPLGAIQWSWGLDLTMTRDLVRSRRRNAASDREPICGHGCTARDFAAGADGGAASTDATAPSSAITSPTAVRQCRRECRSQSAARRPIRAGVLWEVLRFQSMAVPLGTRPAAAILELHLVAHDRRVADHQEPCSR